MNLLQSVILVALVLLTLFNLYALTIGRKKKKQAVALYQKTLADLEVKTFAEMKKRQLFFSEKHGYINDLNEGILLTFDHEKKKMGITLKDAFYLIPFSDVVSCTASHTTLDNGKWIDIIVQLETEKQVITLLFGAKSWKSNSTLANFILSDTKEFCTLVTKYCIEKEEPETTKRPD